MPKLRKTKNRDLRKRILIICEGKRTEPLYFNGIKRDIRSSGLNIKVMDRPKNSGLELVKHAVRLKDSAAEENNKYDSVWIVLDKDTYSKLAETFSEAGKNNINIAFSSVSFEIWYLLHYEFTTKPWRNYSELEKELKKHISDYDKSKSDIYLILQDRTSAAVANAVRLREHHKDDIEKGKEIYELGCYTDVDVLVDILLQD